VLDKVLLAKTRTERRYFAGYVIIASALIVLIVLLQSFRYRLFGTTLLLGWDTPSYVWMARYAIAKGPINMVAAWGFPYFYSLIVAFFGYLTGDVVMVERILPILFGVVLIWANSELVFGITKNVHAAGLAAVLSAISVNVLRLVSDLHRTLMGVSLSTIALLLVPNVGERKSLVDKVYLSLILLLFVTAITQIEVYFVFSLSLALYGILTKNLKKLLMLTLACAIPVAVLVPLFSKFFFGYFGTLVYVEYQLPVSIALFWTEGSWIMLGVIIVGSYVFLKSKLRNRKLVSPIFSWSIVLLALISLIGAGIIHLPTDFAFRSMIIYPIPALMAFIAEGCNYMNHQQQTETSLSTQKRRSFKAIFRRTLPVLIAFLLIGSSVFLVAQYVNGFLTPFIPRSGYDKIMKTKQLLAGRYTSAPIFVFRGDPPVWYANLYRNYLGAEIGEHFAYYGDIVKLFQFERSEPEIKYDPYLSQLEKHYISFYFDEMLGNFSGPPPPMYVHGSYITNLTELMAHPIIIITPEFYNHEIPYCLKPFQEGDGIYIIPPNSEINFSKVSQGPEITVFKNNIPFKINSTYLYIDPQDPSIVHLSVNASQGYTSYNFTDYPSNWTFQDIEQGGDISFPEVDPRRVNGTKAISGNDPADSAAGWSSPWPEQAATLEIDTSTKKEGLASLKITGRTDSWGDLGAGYNSSGTWNLSGYSSISVWAKSNESATFSISLIDINGRSRTFWSLEAGKVSATTSWKRFATNLTDYTSETSGFNISAVDSVDLYVYSNVKKSMTFWVDDLMVDTALNLKQSVYKDRVPVNETIVAYFYTHLEDPQLVHTACRRDPVDNGLTADSPSSPDVCVSKRTNDPAGRAANRLFSQLHLAF
jgi:hypothetical protein